MASTMTLGEGIIVWGRAPMSNGVTAYTISTRAGGGGGLVSQVSVGRCEKCGEKVCVIRRRRLL